MAARHRSRVTAGARGPQALQLLAPGRLQLVVTLQASQHPSWLQKTARALKQHLKSHHQQQQQQQQQLKGRAGSAGPHLCRCASPPPPTNEQQTWLSPLAPVAAGPTTWLAACGWAYTPCHPSPWPQQGAWRGMVMTGAQMGTSLSLAAAITPAAWPPASAGALRAVGAA